MSVEFDLFEGQEPPSHEIPTHYIDINGRAEHEEILKDEKRMLEMGLDPYFERMVYLKRWGGWVNER